MDYPYIICEANTGTQLEYEVAKYIRAGYIPCGGVSVLNESCGIKFIQAVVKKEVMI